MRRWILRSIALILMAGCATNAAGAQRVEARPTAIRNVTVIDVSTGRRTQDQTVVLEGARIARVGPARITSVPRDARIVDGRGKYLIPGLWDMHVHLADRAGTAFPLMLAYGVTGARDLYLGMPNATARAVALRDDVTTKRLLGPRLVVGTIVAGREGADEPGMIAAGTPEEGRAAVRSLKEQRADLVKVRNLLDRDTYFAILSEAKRVGIPVDGHVAFSLGAGEASDSGQRTIEHIEDGGILPGCTARDSAFRAEIRAAQSAPKSPRRRANVIALFVRMSAVIDEPSCFALGQRLARNGTAFTPTIGVEPLALDRFDEPPLAGDARRLVPRPMRRWHDSALAALRRDTGEVWQSHFKRQLTIIPIMQRAGVTLLAGTDFGTLGLPAPGLALHRELDLLVQAGLTPLQALQSATINPARALGATDSLGTVSPGKLGDLVLLDADPTIDVANALRVRAVFADGRYLDRRTLDTMLAEVAKSIEAEPDTR